MALVVKNPQANAGDIKDMGSIPGQEDPLEKGMTTHSSTLVWKIPCMEEPGELQPMGLLRVGHDWVTSLSLFTFMYWRRKWQPTPGFLPGESQGRGSLVGCHLWGRTESDTTEVTQQQQQSQTQLKQLSMHTRTSRQSSDFSVTTAKYWHYDIT